MNERWYNKTPEQTAEILKTDIHSGLKKEAVRKRRGRTGKNEIFVVPKTSFKTYLRHILTDFTALLLVLTILIASFFVKRSDLYIMLGILAAYYLISVAAYIRSQKVLGNIEQNALPNARVIREGKLYMVKQEQLVQGDLILLSEGDIIPCDARIVESHDLEVLEVNVTSVPRAVKKWADFIEFDDIAPAKQSNMLFASTIMTSGTCKAIVCGVGEDTLVCKMKKNIPIISHENLGVLDKLRKFSSVWTLCMNVFIILLIIADIVLEKSDRGIFDIFLTGLSLAVSSMSEFFVAFAYVVLACGIFGVVKKYKEVNAGALIKNPSKLEVIKDISCLIVPKEGAFSIRNMKVERVWANGDIHICGERGYERNSIQTLKYALLSTGLYGSSFLVNSSGSNRNMMTSEEEAIINECERLGIYNIGLDEKYPMQDHRSADKTNKFDTTLASFENTHVVAVRGEYNAILDKCRYYTEFGRIYEMTPEKCNEIKIAAALITKEAYKVVAVASGDTYYNNLQRISACQCDLTFEGFVAIREPMLEGAAKNVSKCLSAGIKVIMMCKDVSEHNKCLARSLGVINDDKETVTSGELAQMKEGLFRANAAYYRLYEGLNITQKRFLLNHLRETGEKVGVLATDLDEIILLKETDVAYSQSMTIPSGTSGINLTTDHLYNRDRKGGYSGKSGCEALKFISDVVVSEADKSGEGGFNAIVNSILCAKVIYANLLRMTRYLVTSQLAKILIVLYSIFSGVVLLSPLQILFSSLIMDFAAIMVIAFEKPSQDMLSGKQNFDEMLSKPILKNPYLLVLGTFWAALAVAMVRLLEMYSVISSQTQMSGCIFISLLLTQLVVLDESKKEKSIFIPNIKINGVYLCLLVMLAAFVTFTLAFSAFGAVFGVVQLPLLSWIGILGLPVVVITVYEIYKLITGENKGE
ncbi:MAG: cation transporting ATPase C-terminal domain-containing protein [Firmicutes bacterium]|nr:cation transporting ATPase C-terminal domain-containing protein [Bacillota bacterium]